MIKELLILFSLLFISCSSLVLPTQQNVEGVTFKEDLEVEINGFKFKGTGVIKRANQYKVKVFPSEKIDRIMWQTCHQEDVVDKPKTGWFSKNYEFTLNEVPGVVDVASCSLQIIVLNEASRKNGFATIEFLDQRPEISLPATLKCNGVTTYYLDGVSICQSAAGLVEQITFKEPVLQTGSAGVCDVMQSKDKLIYTFLMPKGTCTYYFSAQRKLNGKRVSHRLQTIGYTEVPPKD